jgi:RNA polymerase-associated protein CTR9
VREAGGHPDLYVEIARLWADSDPLRALRAYRESRRARGEGPIPPALFNNIGCLEYYHGDYAEARACFEQALTAAAAQNLAGADGLLITLFYNLATAYEAEGEVDQAIEVYEKRILVRHPEFIEGACTCWQISAATK